MEYADAIVTSGVRSTTTAYYVQAKTALAAAAEDPTGDQEFRSIGGKPDG